MVYQRKGKRKKQMWSSYKGWNGVVCPVVMCLREHNHNRPRMRTTEREQLKVISLTCFLSRHYRTGYQNNCSSNTTVRKRKPRIWFSRWKELSGYQLLFLRVLTKAHQSHFTYKWQRIVFFSFLHRQVWI